MVLNNKGSILDLVVVVPWVVVIGIVAIIGYMTFYQFETNLPGDIRYAEVNETIENVNDVLLGFDYLFTFLTFGLFAVVVIFAFYVRSHPIFFVFSYLILGILVLVSSILSTAFQDIMSRSELVTYASKFTMINLTIQNLPIILLGVGGMVALVMYSKGGNPV